MWRGEAFLGRPGVVEAIIAVTLTHAWQCSQYVPGSCELAAVLLFAMAEGGSASGLADAEADAFWCFSQLMAEVQDSLADDSSLADQVRRTHELLRAYDPPVADLLAAHGLAALPTLRLGAVLCTRSGFSLADCVRVWDTLLADPKRFDFRECVVIALMLQARGDLLQRGDVGSLCETLLAAPQATDVKALLRTARAVCAFERRCGQGTGAVAFPPRPAPAGGGCRGYHVAVVGSGPAGFYTTKYLFKQAGAAAGAAAGELKVDMFERLPTPFGLVRFGVAPDHPEVKNVVKDFTEVAATPAFRFFGNVEIGKDLPLGELRRMYDAVVMCTGAQGERLLGIPGEDLPGVVGAPAFVKWYNGHPDHAALEPPEPGETAVVLGQGNVALDIARVLCRPPRELHPTDIDAGALARIGEWQRKGLRTVHLVGRRGFVQAAFTNAELRELLTISDEVLPVVDPEELALCRNAASEQELAKSRMKKRSVSILEQMAANFAQRESTSKRVIWLRFLLSPSAFLASADGGQLAGVRLDRTELQGEPGRQAAVKASSGATEDIACGAVFRSVGFDLTPLEGLPLDGRRRVPHAQGRVELPAAAGGLYVSGWVKRGPQGIIASNITDAQETSARVLADLQARESAVAAGPAGLEALLGAAGARVVSFEDWRRLEAEEARRGAADKRLACKLTDVGEMLRLLEAPR
mmetsp:Transcript_85572/g.266352  ORF Transcript_85572/g.266352 Transcript_85572/m.266352 type:complete len:695 (-) Transcript_85572:14-2098(-)